MSLSKAIRTHKKTAAAVLTLAVPLVAVATFTTVKHVSPASWGWYGPVDEHDGLALRGFDAVALHDGRVAAGFEQFSVTHEGAKWRFENAEALAKFRADPQLYLPAFGGFCSFAMSRGFTATADPHAHHRVGDELFVFDSPDFRDQWVSELPASLEKSRHNWAARN